LQHVARKRGDEAKDPVLNAERAGAKLVSDDLGFAAPTKSSEQLSVRGRAL
jgi:hypothetical protein